VGTREVGKVSTHSKVAHQRRRLAGPKLLPTMISVELDVTGKPEFLYARLKSSCYYFALLFKICQ
jgi:hypothetical protein